ncbi:hypothetical protein [Acidovorax sp.]|uniref:DUF7684 family protein n=1 Tax=Acidovorax sp. TaxID=1872122 RepID=UPI0025C58DB6|nr:hypothetical protein [Acidovorax sp.]
MNLLAENEGKIYLAIAIDAPGDFSSPFSGALFPCMIWDHDGRFTDAQRSEVANLLLDAGCRYAVCGGHNCDAWHDAVDQEFLRRRPDDPNTTWDAAHVMTTCHEDENPDDVAFFFVLNTNFDDHSFEHYLVVHVGNGQAKEQVNAAVRLYALNEQAI